MVFLSWQFGRLPFLWPDCTAGRAQLGKVTFQPQGTSMSGPCAELAARDSHQLCTVCGLRGVLECLSPARAVCTPVSESRPGFPLSQLSQPIHRLTLILKVKYRNATNKHRELLLSKFNLLDSFTHPEICFPIRLSKLLL